MWVKGIIRINPTATVKRGSATNDTELFRREFTSHLGIDFLLVSPNGTLLQLDALSDSIRNGYGSNPDFRIAIRNVLVCRCWDGYLLATYEEWQQGAKMSSPPNNGRIASVLFSTHEDLIWLHVHETWLPKSVIESDAFDF